VIAVIQSAGIVQTVPETEIGRIIQAGGMVAEIVPRDVALRFAGELPPETWVLSPKASAFDMTRVMNIMGIPAMTAAMKA
jgi:hypothetical protein